MVSVSNWILEFDYTKVLDYDELKKSVQEFVKIFPDKKDFYLNLLDDASKEIDFYGWDDIQFPYRDEEEIYFLKVINPYMSGRVEWYNKDDEEKIELSFSNDEPILNRASMSWWEDEEAFEIDEVNPKVARLIALNKLKELNKGNSGNKNV